MPTLLLKWERLLEYMPKNISPLNYKQYNWPQQVNHKQDETEYCTPISKSPPGHLVLEASRLKKQIYIYSIVWCRCRIARPQVFNRIALWVLPNLEANGEASFRPSTSCLPWAWKQLCCSCFLWATSQQGPAPCCMLWPGPWLHPSPQPIVPSEVAPLN